MNTRLDQQKADISTDFNSKFDGINRLFDKQDIEWRNINFILNIKLAEQNKKLTELDNIIVTPRSYNADVLSQVKQQMVAFEKHLDNKFLSSQSDYARAYSSLEERNAEIQDKIKQLNDQFQYLQATESSRLLNGSVAKSRSVGYVAYCTRNHSTSVLLHHSDKQWSEEVPKFSGNSSDILKAGRVHQIVWVKLYRGFDMPWIEPKLNNFPLEVLLEQLWIPRIRGNLRALLHTERYDPKISKLLEQLFSEVYERTRHLDVAMGDEELAKVIIAQLLPRYQAQWPDRLFTNLTETSDSSY
ncbi:hypothetical protein PR048_008140 [Dryococelus australis]|uniref:Uncharacterized protein n=1 Tax=Dryococelus australis TaxID=614101 RepID=A0ABQ9HW92_9NEOP|nr:hypothetical protein PR048_008140 [Dryococelus australis]